MMHIRTERDDEDRRRQRGASLVEYVMLMALIAVVCIAALSYFGNSSKNSVGHSTTCITTAGTASPSCP